MSLFTTVQTWLRRPRSTRTLIKASVVSVIVATIASVGVFTSYPEAVQANSLASFAHPAQKAASPPAPAPATTPATTSPSCTPGVDTSVQAPSVSADQPGLHQVAVTSNTYTVFGDSVDAVNAQMARCTPTNNGNDRFAASTVYSINWSFRYQSGTDGLCTVTSASVGLAIGQIFPAWQPSSGSSSALRNSWQTFITNLATHENGHRALDQATAATILSDLQNVPATNCGDIEAAANNKANSDLAALDQANDAYDSNTNHGVTQGAILR